MPIDGLDEGSLLGPYSEPPPPPPHFFLQKAEIPPNLIGKLKKIIFGIWLTQKKKFCPCKYFSSNVQVSIKNSSRKIRQKAVAPLSAALPSRKAHLFPQRRNPLFVLLL